MDPDATTIPPSTLVIPCFNEAARLRPPAFLDALDRYPWLGLIFVDDGSSDGTVDVLRQIVNRADGRARLVVLSRNSGKAEAVRVGMLTAFKSMPVFAGYWDADLSTPLDAVPALASVLCRNPAIEVVLGSRVQLLGRHIRRSAWRHYLGRIFATGASLALSLPVYDTQCGAKLVRVNERTRSIFTEPFRTRWVFDVELIARFLQASRAAEPDGPAPAARLYELPLYEWLDEPGSKVRLIDGLRAFIDLYRVRRDYGPRPNGRQGS
ncbi:MAG TPA: glycosyltransferase [Vicinamibacterales bacterium]